MTLMEGKLPRKMTSQIEKWIFSSNISSGLLYQDSVEHWVFEFGTSSLDWFRLSYWKSDKSVWALHVGWTGTQIIMM